MTLETEAKFPVRDFSLVETNLQHHGDPIAPWYFEANQVHDSLSRDLLAKGVLLRLRKALVTTVTLKLPLDTPTNIPGLKQLEERECRVEDKDSMAAILQGLGYEKILEYEKFRSTWQVAKTRVCLDILCFGSFVEIEGTGRDIFETAKLLGLDPSTATSATYHRLFQEYLVTMGLPPDDSFVFSHRKRSLYGHQLGIDVP
jgi:adenylate cyclase class 2